MISTRGRYGLRVMLDLAQHRDAGPVPLRDVAERQGISKKYLEILMRDLVQGGLVSGVSGKKGGYRLTRLPEAYTVWEILTLLEGGMHTVACLVPGAPACPREKACATLSLWAEYDRMTRAFFEDRKLSDLLPPGP